MNYVRCMFVRSRQGLFQFLHFDQFELTEPADEPTMYEDLLGILYTPQVQFLSFLIMNLAFILVRRSNASVQYSHLSFTAITHFVFPIKSTISS